MFNHQHSVPPAPPSPSIFTVLMEDKEVERREVMNPVFEATHEVKLRELLHKINSIEVKLCSDASKEFIKLLNGDSGGEFLRLYVQSTSNFSELLGALKLRQGKPGISYVFSLISVILGHPDGKYKPNDKERIGVSVVLDKLARTFIEEKLEELYKELTSNDEKRQNAALQLLASIVRRGSGLASDVANKFDFKLLKGFSKVGRHKKGHIDKNRKHSTRRAFVGFAMSFVEMAKPGLLRWVLQQRETYSGVLRGLENDDDETVVYILSTLRDRVLTDESLVPPSLRSVLFGSHVLEQLAGISGRGNYESSEIAYNVLQMVCTDPCNGLMPDYKRNPSPLRGNPKRLLELMKKLKATEISYHRDLLLSIVRGRLSFGSAFLEEFPYNLEDFSSLSWFSSVSLAANSISSMIAGSPFGFLNSESGDPPSFDNVDVQSVISIFHSRPLSRSMITKGLQHSDFVVKIGTLRLLLEALNLLDSFFKAIKLSSNRNRQNHKWKALMLDIRNEIQTLLPDVQVLRKLLSELNSSVGAGDSRLKRTAEKGDCSPCSVKKKKRRTARDEEDDIIIGGIGLASDIVLPSDGENIVDSPSPPSSESTLDFVNVISELWGHPFSMPVTTPKDAEIFFYSKVLDALKIYLLLMPTAPEDFKSLMNLLKEPSKLESSLLVSLLNILVEFIRTSMERESAIKAPPFENRDLQTFLHLFIFSPVGEIKIQACQLAQAYMSSTGAFDRNFHEIFAWLSFLPGYSAVNSSVEDHGVEVLQSLLEAVISFLCDAVITTRNNLFRLWDDIRDFAYQMDEFRDSSPEFSPLVKCVLQKCIRLLASSSGKSSLTEKSIKSVYVCNTLKYLLQVQEDSSFLAAFISSALSKELQDCCSAEQSSEWRPLKDLLLFAESLLHERKSCFSLVEQRDMLIDRSPMEVLSEVTKMVESGDVSKFDRVARTFSSSIICATSDGVLKNFPTIMTLSQHIHLPYSFLWFIIYLHQSFLADVWKLWPTVFLPGLDKASCTVDSQSKNNAFAQETVLSVNFRASESAAADAFGLFLGQAPFHVLFPAILFGDNPNLPEFPMLTDLLIAKLADCTSDFMILHLRLILFWFYQIQLSYRIKPLAKFEEYAKLCYVLVNHMLSQLLVYRHSSEDILASNLIREVAEIIFCHPVVKESFSCSLDGHDNIGNEDFIEENFGDDTEVFLGFCRQRVNVIDCYLADMLKSTLDCLSLLDGKHCVLEDDSKKRVAKAFKTLKQRIYTELKDQINKCIRTNFLLPLLQPFYALHALLQFISPFELFELANWIFDRAELSYSTGQESCGKPAFYIGFSIANDAFKMLSAYLEHPVSTRELLNTFWDVERKHLGATLIEEMYMKQCKFASTLKLDFAYSCLLEALTALCRVKSMKCDLLDPLGLVLSRIILLTPMDIVFYFIDGASTTKSKLLFLLVDMSPLHLSFFGYLLSGTLSDNFHIKRDKLDETFEMSLSNVDYSLLLPAACSYLNSFLEKSELPSDERFSKISKFYSELVLKGICDWKKFVSGDIFQGSHDMPSSVEEFVSSLDASNLGKAMHILKCHFFVSGHIELDRRLKILRCLLSCSGAYDKLLDCDVDELGFYPLKQSLNLVYRVAAKILFCRMMLFPNYSTILSPTKGKDRNYKTTFLKSVSTEEDQSRTHFIQSLVNTWQCLVNKFSSDLHASTKKNHDCLQLYKYLELFILELIHELLVEMHDYLIQLQTIPFVEQLVRSTLLYRFEDPKTLNVLRSILTLFSEGKFSYLPFLQLLLAHSQFASTIHSVVDLNSPPTVASFRPMPSILKSVSIPQNLRNESQATDPRSWQIEILKLLRILIQSKPVLAGCSCSRKDNAVNFRELYFLLLSSYGATLSEIDLEIYSLMSKIESIDRLASADLVDLDYLWGQAALKIKKDRALDASSRIMTNTEAFAEHRRSQFRENLLIDPKMCAATVIYYPYDRTVGTDPGAFKDMALAHSASVKKMKRYDPVFILRFAIQILSMGYIEPVEFAGLGLLAIAFVSTSSPDVEIRKLAYHFIQKFKEALERCQKKKDVKLLLLLVIYMQNGVEEDWQRFPSITTIFAAEASLILLDPSNDHHAALNEHLMHPSMKNGKGIPFFRTLFERNSAHLRAERQWILRLAWAGLNLDEDAHFYTKNFIPRIVLSFYSTPLVDSASKELILQVVKKSMKLHNTTCDLVKRNGVIPWLSSVIFNSSWNLEENDKRSSSLQLVGAIEAVVDILQSEEILEWLQHNALEQIMEVASYLHKHFLGGSKFNNNVGIIDPSLRIMTATLKLSQRRKTYEPHFTLSFEDLYQIYKACCAVHASSSSPTAESGLTAILMSTPPVDICYEDQEKLSGFLTWAVSFALKSDSAKSFPLKNHAPSDDEPMVSKLLRWLVSAVILSKLHWKLNDVYTKFSKTSNPTTLQCFLEYVDIGSQGSKCPESESAGILADTIVFLQQQLGCNFTILSSVVAALNILLFGCTSKYSDLLNCYKSDVVALQSRVCCPAEASPKWRWSYEEAWRDVEIERTDLERMDEYEACQSLMVIISNFLKAKPFDSRVLSHRDQVMSNVFEWEKICLRSNM